MEIVSSSSVSITRNTEFDPFVSAIIDIPTQTRKKRVRRAEADTLQKKEIMETNYRSK